MKKNKTKFLEDIKAVSGIYSGKGDVEATDK